jgi:putative addiction module component (TIGR02574 family)
MKLEITVPDDLCSAADSLAARIGMNRDELYAAAVAEYLAKHSDAEITERLNRLYLSETSTLELPFRRAQATTISFPELLELSVAERIQRVEDIWRSIAAEPDAVPLSEELRDELDRRMAEQAANPGTGKPWSEVKARLLGGP